MDLAALGQIAGIAGIAIGAAVLVLRPLAEKALVGVPARDRARVATTIALCAFGIGLAGIAAWSFAGSPGPTSVTTHGAEAPAVAAAGNVSIGGSGGAFFAPQAAGPAPAAPPAGARIETRGDRSPAIAAGGDVHIRSDGGVPPSPPPTQPQSRP